MKKSLLALAALGAFAGAASAQSSVTLSGIVDAGVARVGTATGHDWRMQPSQSGYSAFTISGREDLGGGMSAFFLLNHRFRIQNGNTRGTTNADATELTTFWRNTAVGLAGGFGDVRLGRILMPLQDMDAGFDPFATGTVGSVYSGGINATLRANNAIYYRSPKLGGLSVHAAIAAGEGQIAGEHGGGLAGAVTPTAQLNRERPLGASVRYAAGPLNVGLAYDRNTADLKTTGVYGAYDFGIFKLLGAFEKGDTFRGSAAAPGVAEDLKFFSIGLTAPFGPVLLRTGYARLNSDRNLCLNGAAGTSACDGNKFGFGGDYSLSKRTNLYATAAKSSGNRFTVAQKKAAFDVGVTHRF
ncbi:MAG: porin [Burkholderiaceae bacterium]|nr:porin [Burkholderiaceae bacterium]